MHGAVPLLLILKQNKESDRPFLSDWYRARFLDELEKLMHRVVAKDSGISHPSNLKKKIKTFQFWPGTAEPGGWGGFSPPPPIIFKS